MAKLRKWFFIGLILNYHFPNEMNNIQTVTTFKLLGVLLKSDLNFSDHASSFVTVYNQRLHILFLLRLQELGID